MPLAFTADENVNKTLVNLVRVSGYSVTHITEVSPGSPDKAVLHHSSSQNAILITTDKHFGELVFRQRRTTSGVLLVRLHALSPTARAHRVLDFIDQYTNALLDSFTVVTPNAVRIRKMA